MKIRRTTAADMPFGHGDRDYVSDADAVAELVACRLKVVREEWRLDMSLGVPYFPVNGSNAKTFAQMPADTSFVESEMKACILQTEGVATLDLFVSEFDHETRACTVSASGTTVFGSTWDTTVSMGAMA
jgi:hypothetical protein